MINTSKLRWHDGEWSQSDTQLESPQLVLLFGAGSNLRDKAIRASLRKRVGSATIVGCSTAGEILGGSVGDDGLVALALEFDTTTVRSAYREIDNANESESVGEALAEDLTAPGLRHVLVFSDGLKVNGTSLARGLRSKLPAEVSATGGLAGDGPRFENTTVVLDERAGSGLVAAIGLYGPDLEVHWGSAGGWSAFGPKRKVTRAKDNVLFELDDKPALALYKTYLGDRAEGLPSTGLLFPLELVAEDVSSTGLVRTILAVDEDKQSLTFAGDVPEGRYVRLMKASTDKLIWGAEYAVEMMAAPETKPEVALLVSCVGRRLVLGQRVEEEVEAVATELGNPSGVVGFYSYGEIGPGGLSHGCELHNQTMTLTTLAERESSSL